MSKRTNNNNNNKFVKPFIDIIIMPLFTSKALRFVVSIGVVSVFASIAGANELRQGGQGKKEGRMLDPCPLVTYIAKLKDAETCANTKTVVEGVGGTLKLCNDGYPEIGKVAIFDVCEEHKDTVSMCAEEMAEDDHWSLNDEVVSEPEEAIQERGRRRTMNNDDPTLASTFARQWHMRAIGADDAWNCGRLGSPGVTVAILDSGLDYTHQELAGLVDLSRSASFVPSDDAFVASNFPGRHFVTDLNGHGTHVGNTVASNAISVAGVTSKTTLIGVKVLDINNSGSTAGVLQGLMYAADQGADVANMSLGGGSGSSVMINIVFLLANAMGMTVVVSAGNDNLNLDATGFDRYCEAFGVICVAATGPLSSEGVNGPFYFVDFPALGYSNFGFNAVDVAGPGGSFGGSVWQACSTTRQSSFCGQGWILGLQGTSMAAPHVTGLAALLVEDLGRMPAQIKSMIEETADDMGKLDIPGGILGLGGLPFPHYGTNGRINVPRAVCPPMCCSNEHNGMAVGIYPVAGCSGFVQCFLQKGMIMQSMVQDCQDGLEFNPVCPWNPEDNPGGCCDFADKFQCPDDEDLCRPGVGSD